MSKIFANRGFQIHFAVYVLVNIILAAVNLTFDRNTIWFIWPLLGWGFGILGHAYGAYKSQPARPFPARPAPPATGV